MRTLIWFMAHLYSICLYITSQRATGGSSYTKGWLTPGHIVSGSKQMLLYNSSLREAGVSFDQMWLLLQSYWSVIMLVLNSEVADRYDNLSNLAVIWHVLCCDSLIFVTLLTQVSLNMNPIFSLIKMHPFFYSLQIMLRCLGLWSGRLCKP